MASRDVSFLTFFVLWARVQGWKVPSLHVKICVWLEHCTEPERVLMVFRGAAKSTIYAVYKAWRLYKDRQHRSLVWSADNDTAGMLTADVVNVLRAHPLTGGMLPRRPGAKRFWVNGARDARNASMRANGVNKNATGARADAVDFDDIEVPGNIETTEARLKLRNRISESVHIAVPGAQKTYIGTPHTHNSIYPERIEAGAAVLKIQLFEHAARFKDTGERKRYPFPHPVGSDGLYVMAGIHKGARLLVEGVDYTRDGEWVVFPSPPEVTIDIASMCSWPERFNRTEIERRRKETRTFNAWDSQYMLEAKPLEEVRLDPDAIPLYDCEPHFDTGNKVLRMWLGKARIVGAGFHWDPSGAKPNSDVSALGLILNDDQGRRYWHRAIALSGEVAEFGRDDKTIVGGQVAQICDVVMQFGLRRVKVETNGAGTFAPAILKTALKQRHLQCAVVDLHETRNKNKTILEAFEGPISSGMLWAHVSVADGPAFDEMRQWVPTVLKQADDYLDAAAKAIIDQPERVGHLVRNLTVPDREDWRPNTGAFEVEITV